MKFFIPKEDIKEIYKTDGNSGCFVSNRIVVDGKKVGYMYREKPDSCFPDSGWRFFAGDEDDEYVNTPENIKIVDLNTVCNYDIDIIKYLNMPYGVNLFKDGDVFIVE